MKEVEIYSIQEYINYIESYKGEYYFRGQADAGWDIVPNIFRDSNKLKNECAEIDESYSNNSIDIIKKILKIQHYGNGTRLCDVTVNPMVALYFAIENEKEDAKPCAIFIFDKSANITFDSLEMQVLLILTVKEISTLDELQSEVIDKLGITLDKEHLKKIITNNYLIDYDINLSYSNNRALLQGGTGIYFGFDVIDNSIIRKGSLDIGSLCTKIIIPSNKKSEIRTYLQKYGISKAVLYDNANGVNKSLSYYISERNVRRGTDFNKVLLDIRISDIIFVEADIQKIVTEVFQKSKKQYGENARIFMYVYYDEEETRSTNWIARPTPTNDFNDFELNFNNDYHTRRMTYFNQEVSINIIFNTAEPIVDKCKKGLKDIEEAHDKYFSGRISKQDYKSLLEKIKKALFNPVYYELDVSHGRGIYQDYYESSYNFCMDVIAIAEEQIYCIDRNQNDASIDYDYNMRFKMYEKSYQKYLAALENIKIPE